MAGKLVVNASPQILLAKIDRLDLLRSMSGAIRVPTDLLTRVRVPERTGARATLGNLEAEHIRSALERHGWHRSRAAAELGMHRTTLARKIRRLGIELPRKDGRSSR